MKQSFPLRRAEFWILLVVLLAGFMLRLPAPGTAPPGLYHDEAYNGIDAVSVLDGDWRLFYPANNGREPLHIYLMAAFVAVLGRTPAALRLAMAFAGVGLVAATFAMGAALYDRRIGLIGAALVAVAPWPVILGRVGLRAGLLPLVLALAVAATVRGLRGGGQRWLIAGGALAGLSMYTYAAARAGPLLLILFGLWLLARRRPPERRVVVVWLAAAVVVALPLAVVFVADPDGTVGRIGQVALVGGGSGGASEGVVRQLTDSLSATAGMLFAQGDFIPRHNIPLRPVFGPFAAALAVFGIVLALVTAVGALMSRAGQPSGGSNESVSAEPTDGSSGDACALVLLWLVAYLLPTALSDGAPHFLRASGALPALALLPALGAGFLAALAGRLGRFGPHVAWGFAALAVLAELGATVGYASEARSGPTAASLYYQFESGASALSRDANAALGRGWQGGWADARQREGHDVWLDRRLRDGWAAVPYLVPIEDVTLTDPYDPVLTTGPGVAYLWPHDIDLANVWSAHSPNLRLDFTAGSFEKGDLDAAPRMLYLRVDATPAQEVTQPDARFANGLVLIRSSLQPSEDGRDLIVETEWAVDEPVARDVTAFFQVLDDGAVVDGSDAPLGAGHYPVSHWRVGDRVVERRRLQVPDGFDVESHTVIAGLYEWPSVDRIKARDGRGRLIGDHVVLPDQ